MWPSGGHLAEWDYSRTLLAWLRTEQAVKLHVCFTTCIFYVCIYVYVCECMPASVGQAGLARNRHQKRLADEAINPFTCLLAAQGSKQFPSCSACNLTSRAVPPLSFPRPNSWPCIWEAPTTFKQPGPSRVHLWLHLQWLLWLRGFTKASRSSLPAILTLRACMKLPERCVGSQRKHCKQLTPLLGGVCAQKIIQKKW